MLLLIGILLIAFLATVAFSLDVAYMHLVKAELRASTDAAAKAAVTILVVEEDEALARQAAKDTAAANLVAGQPLPLVDSDIVFGNFTLHSSGKMVFSPGGSPYTAARVSGHRDSVSAAGKVSLFFGHILGTPAFSPVTTSTAARLERDLVLVLDRSGSMGGSTSDGTKKIEALKTAVGTFLTIVSRSPFDEQVGLVSYDDQITKENDLTKTFNVIRGKVNTLSPRGMTNIGDAIAEGNNVLAGTNTRNFADKTMILMTDGIWNTGSSPTTIASQSATSGITIHTITFGTGADQAEMQAVAAAAGGQHFHADTGTQLDQVFEQIARSLTSVLID